MAGTESLLHLQWNNHKSTFCHILNKLRFEARYCDATLACGGRLFPVHRLVLASCSDFFNSVFSEVGEESWHAVVVLQDARPRDLEYLLDYIYCGEVSVPKADLDSLLSTAHCLRIKDLAPATSSPTSPTAGEGQKPGSHESSQSRESPPRKRRKRTSTCEVGDEQATTPECGDEGPTTLPHPTSVSIQQQQQQQQHPTPHPPMAEEEEEETPGEGGIEPLEPPDQPVPPPTDSQDYCQLVVKTEVKEEEESEVVEEMLGYTELKWVAGVVEASPPTPVPSQRTRSGPLPMPPFPLEPSPVGSVSMPVRQPEQLSVVPDVFLVPPAPPHLGPQYQLLPTGSRAGRPLLVDSLGNSYNKKNPGRGRNLAKVVFTCSQRWKGVYCPAKVYQLGDQYVTGQQPHNHPHKDGRPAGGWDKPCSDAEHMVDLVDVDVAEEQPAVSAVVGSTEYNCEDQQ